MLSVWSTLTCFAVRGRKHVLEKQPHVIPYTRGSNVCGILPAWCVSANNPWLANSKTPVLCDLRPRVTHSLGGNNVNKESIEAIVAMLSSNTTITSIGQVCCAGVHGGCLM